MSERALRFSILDLDAGDEEAIRQAANLLVEGFRDDWPEAWPTEEEALEEVREALGEGRISRVALGEEGGEALPLRPGQGKSPELNAPGSLLTK